MNEYTIYCTIEQTKKSFELGAPIEIKYGSDRYNPSSDELRYLVNYDHMWYKKPTAEQMIGWLEEQDSIACVNIDYYVTDNTWAYWIKFKGDGVYNKQGFNSRKESTIAAIDAALDYLLNN